MLAHMENDDCFLYFSGTTSPVLISLATAALTLEGVKRLILPSYGRHESLDIAISHALTLSFSPHTQAVWTLGGA